MDLKEIKLTSKLIKDTVKPNLLKVFMTLAQEDKILKQTMDCDNLHDYINRLFAALVCLSDKSEKLESGLMNDLKNQIDKLENIKQGIPNEINLKIPSGS